MDGIMISTDNAEQAVELLELCDGFLRLATPAVRAELARYLAERPAAPDSDLLIDLLGFTALFLQAKLAVAERQNPKPSP